MTVLIESLMTSIGVGATAATTTAATTAAAATTTAATTTAATTGTVASLAAAAGVGAEALTVTGLGGAGAAAAGGTSVLAMLSGGATAFSALAGLAAMNAQGNALKAAEKTEEFNAGLAITEGIWRENEITKRLLGTLGAQNVRAGAAGFDLGVGAGALRQNAIDEAEKQIRMEQRRAKLEAFGRRRRAQSLSIDASATRLAGAAQTGSTLASAADRSLARG